MTLFYLIINRQYPISKFTNISGLMSESEIQQEIQPEIESKDKSEYTNVINLLSNNIIELKNELSSLKSNINKSQDIPDNVNPLNFDPVINPIITPPVIIDPIANYDRAKLLDPLVDPRGRTSADQIPTPQIAAQFNFPTQGFVDRYHRVGLLIAIDKPNMDNIVNKPHKQHKHREHKRTKYYDNLKLSDNSSISTNSTTSTDSSKEYNGIEFASSKIEQFGNYSDEGPNGILELIGKKYTDNWYKYFTSISKGNKIIKINIHNRNRRELYSGDEVYIPELERTYQVQIDEMDMIEYNPYFFTPFDI
jgi:hypothetical protein